MRYLALLLLPVLAVITAPARALTIYKCTGAEGIVAFQATPCAGQQRGSTFALRPEPTAAAAPAAVRPDRETTRTSSRLRRPAAAAPRARARTAVVSVTPDASWECRAANGDVFYQHSACPAAIGGSIELRHTATRGRSRGSSTAIAVSGKPIARGDACRRIHAASASDRPGHERDEDVSTYERNLGRDPCR